MKTGKPTLMINLDANLASSLMSPIFLFVFFNIISFKISAQDFVVKPYLQDVSKDKVIIMWEANSAGDGHVKYGTDPFSLVNSNNSLIIDGSGQSKIHAASLESLTPKTKYYYKVVMAGGQESKLRTFKTLQPTNEDQSIQLIAISDMQRDGSKPTKFKEIVEDGIIPKLLEEVGDSLYELEGILIPGDLVVTGGNYPQWENHFFDHADTIAASVPIYPVPGNHEYSGGGLPNFKKYFSLPQNGPASIIEECWYKDISNVRLIGLNSNSNGNDQNEQLNWLSEVLDSTCNNGFTDFVFAELHHPFKSELWTPGENSFTGKVIDSLENFTQDCGKASIHFFGHTHGYSRGQSMDHKHLWVNVATAGGAIDNWGEFPNMDYPEFVKSQDEYGFVLLDVTAGDDPMFSLRRYTTGDQDIILDNVLRDSITILNIDMAPNKPENIFPVDDTVSFQCLQLKASEFYGIDDIHQGSHWQISGDLIFGENEDFEKWKQNENFYNEINTQADDDLTDQDFMEINEEGEYFWRVRYRNQNLEWSEWSTPSTFVLQNTTDTISSNLVLNADAEDGINDWSGDIESIENSDCGSVPPYNGNFNFAVGGVCQNESSVGIAEQSIDLSAYSSQIDLGIYSVGFGGYLRNFSGSDIPEVYVQLFDNGNLVAESDKYSNVTPTWIKTSGIISIPIGVDSCKLLLKGTRTAGTDNDSYFDDLFLFIVESSECVTCFGKSGIDNDGDGYCSDLDCNDEDLNIFPGAIEVCNSEDDNCDGIEDFGNTVHWVGGPDLGKWSDAENWDQQMVPLPCQHVIIDNGSLVTLDGDYECLSLVVGSNDQLIIESGSNLIVNSQNLANQSSVTISGTMTINGRCDIKNTLGKGFEVFGILINNNKLNLSDISLENILLKEGGRFDSLGSIFIK